MHSLRPNQRQSKHLSFWSIFIVIKMLPAVPFWPPWSFDHYSAPRQCHRLFQIFTFPKSNSECQRLYFGHPPKNLKSPFSYYKFLKKMTANVCVPLEKSSWSPYECQWCLVTFVTSHCPKIRPSCFKIIDSSAIMCLFAVFARATNLAREEADPWRVRSVPLFVCGHHGHFIGANLPIFDHFQRVAIAFLNELH